MIRTGILGAGQLGQMLALAGYPLGQRFVFLDNSNSPSADIGTTLTAADLQAFLAEVDQVTYEFEHLPVALVEEIERHKPVYPGSRALAVCQNRGLEKALFTRLGIPTPDYRLVNSLAELQQALEALQVGQRKLVAKTVTEGYDGKGQAIIHQPDQADAVWQALGERPLIVEAFVDFVREVSILAVRGRTGELAFYPITQNQHEEGILRFSLAPLTDVTPVMQQQAETYIQALLNELDYVGVLTLELFQQADGRLLANEMAPRVHNSGHWTQDGAVTSQFENHLRAVTGLPLGSTRPRGYSCMINLIGQIGDTSRLLTEPDLHLHLYGKSERPGRKLGHINLLADDYSSLLEQLERVCAQLPGISEPKLIIKK